MTDDGNREVDPLDVERTVSVEGRGSSGEGAYTLSPGQTLGQYKIIRTLGRGGMGEVYEAEHQVLRRRYALKLLPADFIARPGALDRFQREAQVMANLEHPNIVKVDDFGDTDGRYWLRMETANGVEYGDRQVVSLQDLADAGGGKVEQKTLSGILRQILDALEYAHGRGAVHRDLKPSNILIFNDAGGASFKIADFGLVRLVGEEWVRSQVQVSVQRSMSMGELKTIPGQDSTPAGSSTRSMLGTYEYMSPEQKRGEEATEQSDLYSVGLMAYRLLTGRGLSMKAPSQIDSSLDRAWDAFLGTAMEEDPAERWPTAKQMQAELGVICQSIEVMQREKCAEEESARRREEDARRREAEAAEKQRQLKVQQQLSNAEHFRRKVTGQFAESPRRSGEKQLGSKAEMQPQVGLQKQTSKSQVGLNYAVAIALCLLTTVSAVFFFLANSYGMHLGGSDADFAGIWMGFSVLTFFAVLGHLFSTHGAGVRGYHMRQCTVVLLFGCANLVLLIYFVITFSLSEPAEILLYQKYPPYLLLVLNSVFGGLSLVLAVIGLRNARRDLIKPVPLVGKLAEKWFALSVERGSVVPKPRKSHAGRGVAAALTVIAGALGLISMGDRPSTPPAPQREPAPPPVVQPPSTSRPTTAPARALDTTQLAPKQNLAGENQTVDLGDGVSLELVWIPPGTFAMGSPEYERGRSTDEGPQHQVTISRGFWMGKLPVTQRQYQQLIGETPAHFKNAGLDAPVETVNWREAKEFCERLQSRLSGDLRGLTARLPTDAEWEYACRAGTTTALYSGKELTSTSGRCRNLDEIAWYRENSGGTTRPAGQKQPNAWGLHDMLGNVGEWCEDGKRSYTASAQTDPVGSGSSRVLRGGSWTFRAEICHPAFRIGGDPSTSGYEFGFRVVVR